MPSSDQIDASVVAAPDAMQAQPGCAQGLLDGVFVVCAYVGWAGFRERDVRGIGLEGGEVMMVL